MAELEFFSPEWAAAVRDALTAGPPEPVRAGKLQEYWDLFDFIKSVYPASWALGCRELPAELGAEPAGGPAYLFVQSVFPLSLRPVFFILMRPSLVDGAGGGK